MAIDNKKPVALVILDGWGLRAAADYNAIVAANPVTFNRLWQDYPHASLEASGSAVGLPDGVMGNSEVGHLTIGAGRIIEQALVIINRLIAQNSLCQTPAIQDNFTQLAQTNGALHLIGLLSDGGVHSHHDHLYALITGAIRAGIQKIFIHAILDGRDTGPLSAPIYLSRLETFCKQQKAGVIASICGRFYAMDRDNQWDRTRAAFELYTAPPPVTEHHWSPVLEKMYAQNITDEFVSPTNLHPEGFVRPEDGIFLFNFRPDRMRQLTELLLNQRSLFLISMTRYSKKFTNPVVVEQQDITDTLLDRLEKKNLSIVTIAETEKYAHVTYFFSGGKETIHAHETRVLVPSLGVKNYAEQPCMSAPEITKKILESLESNPADFYLINYANADMVGHTGDFAATERAVTCVDNQLTILYDQIVRKRNGAIFIVGDHGNAEDMWDYVTNSPKTAHTTNPVPFIAINTNQKLPIMKGLSEVAKEVENMW